MSLVQQGPRDRSQHDQKESDSFQAFRHLFAAASQALTVVQNVQRLFKQPAVAADPDLKEQLRDITLSLSALDQVFYAHVDSILEEAKLQPLDRTASLEYAMDRIRRIPAHIALQRMPPGGLTSLLYHFSYVLKTTDETLQAIEKDSSWRRFIRTLWPVGGVVVLALALRLWLAAKRRRGRLHALSQTGVVVVAGILVYRLFMRRHHLIARLKRLHRILLILLRIWLVTRHVFKKTNVARQSSYAVLIADLDATEQETASAVPARKLLEEASLPRDAAIWSFKTAHLGALKVGLDLSYASMKVGWDQLKRGRAWLRWPATVAAAGYYLLFPGQAAEHAQHVMHEQIDIEFVKSVWMQLNSPAARQLSWLRSPALATNRAVEVRGVQCHAFADRVVPDYVFDRSGPETVRMGASSSVGSLLAAATAGAAAGKSQGSGAFPGAMGAGSGSGDSLSSSSSSSIGSREPRAAGAAASSAPQEASSGPGSSPPLDSVMLYIHGGGFVGTSFGLDAGMLAQWAKQEPRLTIVYVHYSLSPEVRFPVALDEIARVYRQLRSWSRRMVVIGESAGGNLAVALALRCVKERVRGPEALVPVYPALNLNDTPSPSRALHINDPLVPIRLLKELAASYVPEEYIGKHCDLPLVNPGLAPDRLLVGLPSTHIVVGGLDPLLDDAIDFSTRLRRLGKPVTLSVYRNLPHGFINFDFVPEARIAVQAIFDMCLESIGLREPRPALQDSASIGRGKSPRGDGKGLAFASGAAGAAGGVRGGEGSPGSSSAAGGAFAHGDLPSTEWSGSDERKITWSDGEVEGEGEGDGRLAVARAVPAGTVSGGQGPGEAAGVDAGWDHESASSPSTPLPGASPYFRSRPALVASGPGDHQPREQAGETRRQFSGERGRRNDQKDFRNSSPLAVHGAS